MKKNYEWRMSNYKWGTGQVEARQDSRTCFIVRSGECPKAEQRWVKPHHARYRFVQVRGVLNPTTHFARIELL